MISLTLSGAGADHAFICKRRDLAKAGKATERPLSTPSSTDITIIMLHSGKTVF